MISQSQELYCNYYDRVENLHRRLLETKVLENNPKNRSNPNKKHVAKINRSKLPSDFFSQPRPLKLQNLSPLIKKPAITPVISQYTFFPKDQFKSNNKLKNLICKVFGSNKSQDIRLEDSPFNRPNRFSKLEKIVINETGYYNGLSKFQKTEQIKAKITTSSKNVQGKMFFIQKLSQMIGIIISFIQCPKQSLSNMEISLKSTEPLLQTNTRIKPFKACSTQRGSILLIRFTDLSLYFLLTNDLKQTHNLSLQCLFQILPTPSLQTNNLQIQSKQGKANQSDINRFLQRIQLMKGIQVRFGEEIIIKHLYSNHFLRSSNQCGESGMGAFKAKLSSYLDKSVIFRIDPFRSFQKQGWIIYLQQPVLIVSMSSKSYLSIGNQQSNIFLDLTIAEPNSDLNELEKDLQILKNRPKIKSPENMNKRVEIIELLKPNIYNKFCKINYNLDESYITNYNMVYFEHTNHNTLLVSDIHADNIYLKQPNFKIQYEIQKGIWEAIQVEKAGKKIFILRHFISGRGIFHTKSNQIHLNSIDFFEIQENSIELASMSEKETISYGDCVLLKTNYNGKISQGQNIEVQYDHQLQKYSDYYQTISLKISENKVQEHSFKIYKVPDQIRQEAKFISSGFQLYIQYAKLLRTVSYLDTYYVQQEKDQPGQYIQQLGNILRYDVIIKEVVFSLQKLEKFIYDQEFEQKPNLNPTKINKRRIRIMRNIGLVEILIEIIYYNGEMIEVVEELFRDSGMTYQKEIILKPYKLSYSILKSMCYDQTNKIYISQWIQMYMEQLIKCNYYFIYNFLLQLLDNNKTSISSQINYDHIEQLVDIYTKLNKISQEVLEKRMRIISLICKSGDDSIKKNQNIARKLLLENELIQYKFILSHENIKSVQKSGKKYNDYSEGIVYVHKIFQQFEQKIQLKAFIQNQQTNFFVAFINFLAVITIHHNIQSKQKIKEIISFQVLCCILDNPDYQQVILLKQFEAFVNVIHYCYIDVKGFQTIRRIAKVREWEKIKEKTVILKSHSQAKKALQVQINCLIRWIKKVMKRTKEMNQVTLVCLISLTKTTITLGLWQDVQEFRELFASIMQNIIKQNYKVTDFYYDPVFSITQKSSHQYNLLMKAKAIALQIIDIMMDMQNNTRISILTCFVKQVMNDQIDISHYSKKKFEIKQDNQSQFFHQLLKFYKNFSYIEKYKDKSNHVFKSQLYVNKIIQLTPKEKQIFVPLSKQRYFFSQISHQDHALYLLIKLAKQTQNNQKVITSSLKIISRIFRQRYDLIEGFSTVIIVAKGQYFKLFKHSREIVRPKIKFMTLPNIKERVFETDQKDDLALWRVYQSNQKQKQKCGVIQQIAYLCQILQTGNRVQNLELRNSFKFETLAPKNMIWRVYNERQNNNYQYQTLIKNQDCHLVFYNYIDLIGGEIENELHLKCVHAIYNYLTMLSWNHPKNKEDLISFMYPAIKHLKYNIGSVDFIRQLAINNSIFLKNESMVNLFINVALQQINKLSIQCYYKSKLLFSLSSLIILYQTAIAKTQITLMSQMQNRQFKNIILYLTHFQKYSTSLFTIDQFKEWIFKYQKQNEKVLSFNDECRLQQNYQLKYSPQLAYVEAFFIVFRSLIECDNNVNKNKCVNMHPIQFLLILLRQSRKCIPVRKAIRGYISHLYYLYLQYDINIFQKLLSQQFGNIQQELSIICQTFIKNYDFCFRMEFDNKLRYNYQASYLYGLLYQDLMLLEAIFSNEKFMDWIRNFINQQKTFNHVMNIIEKIGFIYITYNKKKKQKNRAILNLINQVKWNFLEKIAILSWTSVDKKYNIQSLSLDPDQQDQKKRHKKGKFQYNKKDTFWINFKDYFLFKKSYKNTKHLRLSQNNRERSKKLEYLLFTKGVNYSTQRNLKFIKYYSIQYERKIQIEPDDIENQNLSQIHRALVQMMMQKKIFEALVQDQMQGIGNFFYRLNEGMYKQDQNPKTFCNKFIKNVVNMICKNPREVETNLIQIFVRMLHLYVESKVDRTRIKLLTVDEWVPETCTIEQKKDLRQMQNQLINNGCGKLIVKLLAIERDDQWQLINQILLFAISLLVFGNSDAQNDIFQQLKNDHQNQMIRTLNKYLEKLEPNVSEQKKMNISPSKSKKKQFNLSYLDYLDHYVSQQRVLERTLYTMQAFQKEKKLKRIHIHVISRIYRFMQLLCQNNNIKMKNFLKTQVQKDGSEHPNSINFIQTSCWRLSKKLGQITNQEIKMAIAPLQFMLQISQIPCIENQIILCQSQVFQSLCYLQTNIPYSDQEQQNMNLYDLLNRVSTLIISNMEGKLDQIFVLILNKLSISFLLKLLVECLKYLLIDFKEKYMGPDKKKVMQWQILNTKAQLQKIISYEQILRNNEQPSHKNYNKHLINLLNVVIVVKKAYQWGMDSKNRLGIQYYKKFYEEITMYINQPQMIQYLEELFIAIDIQINGSNQTVYFAKQPIFQYFSQETKNKITWMVNRETHRDKINQLFQHAQEAHLEMEWFYEIHFRGIKSLPINLSTCILAKNISIFMSLIINIYTFLLYHVSFNQEIEINVNYDFWLENLGQQILKFIQITSCIIYVWMWWNIHYQLTKRKNQQQQLKIEQNKNFIVNKLSYPLLEKMYKNVFMWIRGLSALYNDQSQFFGLLLFFGSSIMGTFVDSKYYTLHLFELIDIRAYILSNLVEQRSAFRSGFVMDGIHTSIHHSGDQFQCLLALN